jgi:hypothetical protein
MRIVRLGLGALLLAATSAACERTLLDERFYDKRLLAWTAVDDPDTLEGPSRWEVADDGWLHQKSNIWGRRGDYIGRWYGTFLVAGDPGWKDYTLRLRAKPGDDDGFGVVFRYEDATHFYRLLFIEDKLNGGPLTRLDKRAGADYVELWSAKRGFTVGAEMKIQIHLEGDLISASVDGAQIFQVRDGSYRSGRIGLFCYAQQEQAFDDVKVTAN